MKLQFHGTFGFYQFIPILVLVFILFIDTVAILLIVYKVLYFIINYNFLIITSSYLDEHFCL